MSASNPLETLISRARRQRDSAGKRLADDRHSSQQAEAQLDTLRHYRQEYANRMQQAMRQGVDAATLDNYRQFLQSLDAAIDQALATAAERRDKLSSASVQWHQTQRTLSSYDTLAERRRRREKLQEQRREQRQSDEFTNNASARRQLQSQDPSRE